MHMMYQFCSRHYFAVLRKITDRLIANRRIAEVEP